MHFGVIKKTIVGGADVPEYVLVKNNEVVNFAVLTGLDSVVYSHREFVWYRLSRPHTDTMRIERFRRHLSHITSDVFPVWQGQHWIGVAETSEFAIFAVHSTAVYGDLVCHGLAVVHHGILFFPPTAGLFYRELFYDDVGRLGSFGVSKLPLHGTPLQCSDDGVGEGSKEYPDGKPRGYGVVVRREAFPCAFRPTANSQCGTREFVDWIRFLFGCFGVVVLRFGVVLAGAGLATGRIPLGIVVCLCIFLGWVVRFYGEFTFLRDIFPSPASFVVL